MAGATCQAGAILPPAALSVTCVAMLHGAPSALPGGEWPPAGSIAIAQAGPA